MATKNPSVEISSSEARDFKPVDAESGMVSKAQFEAVSKENTELRAAVNEARKFAYESKDAAQKSGIAEKGAQKQKEQSEGAAKGSEDAAQKSGVSEKGAQRALSDAKKAQEQARNEREKAAESSNIATLATSEAKEAKQATKRNVGETETAKAEAREAKEAAGAILEEIKNMSA